MYRTLACLLLFVFTSQAHADSIMSGPKEAKSTDEIVKIAEDEDLRGLKKTPNVTTVTTKNAKGMSFVAWYNPYSGRSACHVYIYAYDEAKSKWVQKLAKVFDKTHQVSVEFGSSVVVRDFEGNVIHRELDE